MQSNKIDNFNKRQSSSAAAKAALLEKFRARPPADDPAVRERQAALAATAAAREARNAERKAAKEAELARIAAEKKAAEIEKARLAAEERKQAAILAAQQKAARDARYAARKAGKR